MRILFKLVLFPISLLLSVSTAFLTFLLSIGMAILYLLMILCIFVAIGSFLFFQDGRVALEALIVGFILSPYGLPMIGETMIAFLEVERLILPVLLPML